MARTDQGPDVDLDVVRPMVGMRTRSQGLWISGLGILAVAGLLFYTLESHREARVASVELPQSAGSEVIASPPPLNIPAGTYGEPADQGYSAFPLMSPPVQSRAFSQRRPSPSPAVAPPGPVFAPPSWRPEPPLTEAPPAPPPSPSVVYDAGKTTAGPRDNAGDAAAKDERVRASQFQNPSTTIPKGTVIQAVLETALDSTRAGFARAIISRDVFSFDGSQIVIQKGSRLIGQYKADLTLGQSRALIQWQRLMRPDGAIIDIDSPSADPLGRAGVKGKVNTHFIERFGGAILQSSLDIGVQLATNKIANGSVIYALPNSVRGAEPVQPNIQPTVTVHQGTSISVFVAKDLDFTTVQQ